MKRTLFFMLLFVWLSAPAAWAYDFEADGIYYNITSSSDDKTVEVTYYSLDDSGYSGDVTIPETLTYAGTEYRVTAINTFAFNDCTGLTSVTIPESITSIGNWAFSGCSGLTSVTIHEGVTIIGNYVFYDCTGLTSVMIPESVTAIGSNAFSGCTGLTSVTIGKGVTTIDDFAFYDCIGLTSVTVYNPTPIDLLNVNEEGYTHFAFEFVDCDNCTLYVPAESVETYKNAEGWKKFEILPIGASAIYDFQVKDVYYKITSLIDKTVKVTYYSLDDSGYSGDVTIPETVTYDGTEYRVTAINTFAFNDCTGLTSVTIPESITSIGNWAFSGCSGLTSVTLPEGITAIGQGTFSECSGLTSITIPNNVTTIGDFAFFDCGDLTSVTIPNSVTAIDSFAFCFCSSLMAVTIPNSVTTIANRAFENCSNLTFVTIGKGVTTIGDFAFYNCIGLTSVTVYNPTPIDLLNVNEEGYTYFAFEYVDCSNCTLYVPAESVNAYKAAAGWKEFGEILPIGASAIIETQQEQADGHITVYNLQGVPVLETDDAADLKTLQNGAYIVNGKTMIIAR